MLLRTGEADDGRLLILDVSLLRLEAPPSSSSVSDTITESSISMGEYTFMAASRG